MPIKINCKDNDQGAWCKNKNIKRSLFGFGARCCKLYPPSSEHCEYQIKYPRPNPPAPQRRY